MPFRWGDVIKKCFLCICENIENSCTLVCSNRAVRDDASMTMVGEHLANLMQVGRFVA